MPKIDHRALGFALSTSDVAHVLRKSEAEVHDLVRSGMLTCVLNADSPMSPHRMWFHPDEVSYVDVQLNRTTLATDHHNRLRVQAALRAYLEAVPTESRYDVALARNAPLLGKTRGGQRALHVRPEAVAAFGSTLDRVPVTVSMTTGALEYLGAIRIRGVTALDEPGRQRWGIWFRLPPGFAPGDSDEAAAIRGLISGASISGDRVTRRGMGPAQLVAELRGVADEAGDTAEGGEVDLEPDGDDSDYVSEFVPEVPAVRPPASLDEQPHEPED